MPGIDGGIDGTALRCVLKKGAHEQWSLATVDVKCAFLLAPRKETRRTLITRPPKALVEAGIVKASERWLVQGAMYGLDTSPADWSAFRDQGLAGFTQDRTDAGDQCVLQEPEALRLLGDLRGLSGGGTYLLGGECHQEDQSRVGLQRAGVGEEGRMDEVLRNGVEVGRGRRDSPCTTTLVYLGVDAAPRGDAGQTGPVLQAGGS